MNIREYLKENVLLFDGAMGTLCQKLSGEEGCEMLNLTFPEEIEKIHLSYINAGSKAIKTNTFSANRMVMSEDMCIKVIKKGFEIAQKFSKRAFVFADVGPISVNGGDIFEEYKFVADAFIACGAENFLFETASTANGIIEAAEYIKSKCERAYVLVSFAALPDGFTRSGHFVGSLLEAVSESEYVDAVGLNCASGARHMAKFFGELPDFGKSFSVMPNAGYPTVLGNRTYYDGDPAYFAKQIGIMTSQGANIVGGCCGTTPEHISAAKKVLSMPRAAVEKSGKKAKIVPQMSDNFFCELSDSTKRPFAVELDPPESADIEKFMNGAKTLKRGGASVITIADCPIARARMDSSILACKLKRELSIGVLPHMTCRDRNLNAIKALLLALSVEGVHNILTVTGDPIPTSDRSEVKSVYNLNSRMLASYITELGKSESIPPFKIFGALNVNANNFDMQLKLAREKEENGVVGFLTQPILTLAAVENVKRARAELKGKILGGIFPLVSYKNACFMNSEVSGVKIDSRVIAMYEGKGREEGEALAVKISTEVAKAVYEYVDGYYIMTPFSRCELVVKIMDAINSQK